MLIPIDSRAIKSWIQRLRGKTVSVLSLNYEGPFTAIDRQWLRYGTDYRWRWLRCSSL